MRPGENQLTGADLELVLLDGSGRRFGIGEGEELTVGAAAHCKVRLTAPDVSRRHALVARRHGRVVVMDLGSKNGTTIGGRKVVAEVELAPGETVKFSSVAAQIMPTGSPSSDFPVVSPDEQDYEAETDHHSPTGEQADVSLQAGLPDLLGRWAEPNGTVMAGLVEWLVRVRRVSAAAVIERLGDEINVVAAAGSMADVLSELGTIGPALTAPAGPEGETVRLDVAGQQVVSVSRSGLPWLLLVPGPRMLEHEEIDLLIRLVAVAGRLDGSPVRGGR